MRTARPLAALAIAAAATLTACGGNSTVTSSSQPASTPSNAAAACKAAMTSDYEYALAHPDAPSATEPPPCKGLPAATLNQFITEIIASVTPSPSSP